METETCHLRYNNIGRMSGQLFLLTWIKQVNIP